MAQIKDMKTEELLAAVREKQEALRKIRFDVTGAKVKNVKESRELRREVARMLTELSLRNQAGN